MQAFPLAIAMLKWEIQTLLVPEAEFLTTWLSKWSYVRDLVPDTMVPDTIESNTMQDLLRFDRFLRKAD